MLPLIHTTLPLAGAYRTVVEEAALMWMESLHIRQGGYLATLDHYNGELDSDEGIEALFALSGGGLPAVLVATGDETYKRQGRSGAAYRSDCEVEVVVLSGARRSRETQNIGDEHGRNDDTVDPGCYQIMQDVFHAITNRMTGDERITRFVPKFTRVIVQFPKFTAWRTRFAIDWGLIVLKDSELPNPQPIASIHHKHNLVDSDSPPPPSINPVAEGIADET